LQQQVIISTKCNNKPFDQQLLLQQQFAKDDD